MGEHLAVHCQNWGNPVCRPEVRKYLDCDHNRAEGFPFFPINGTMKKVDDICRACEFLKCEKGREGLNREDLYNPVYMISNVWGKFQALPAYRNSRIEDYAVFIEIRRSRNRGYLIEFGDDVFLWRRKPSRTGWTLIEEPEALYRERHSLGKVHVRFKGKKIKIGKRSLAPFPDYETFWDYIRL